MDYDQDMEFDHKDEIDGTCYYRDDEGDLYFIGKKGQWIKA
jgi:hypothetical protein